MTREEIDEALEQIWQEQEMNRREKELETMQRLKNIEYVIAQIATKLGVLIEKPRSQGNKEGTGDKAPIGESSAGGEGRS